MFRIATRHLKSKKISFATHQNGVHFKVSRNYGKEICPPPKKKGSTSTGTIYTIGALVLVSGATAGYAKIDPEFRKKLVSAAPFLDGVLKVVLLEESIGPQLDRQYRSIKAAIFSLFFGADDVGAPRKEKQLEQKDEYKAPPPIIPGIEKKNKKEEKFSEIRKESKNKETVIGGIKKPKVSELPETHPKNLGELEEQVCSSSADAINAYNKAVLALQKYTGELEYIIESSVDKIGSDVWAEVKTLSREKEEAIKEADAKSKIANSNVSKLKHLIKQPDFETDESTRAMLLGNLQRLEDDINLAKETLGAEMKDASVANRYWHKVEAARKHFGDELEALFPSVDFKNKQVSVPAEELDLFITHAYGHVLFYQKELAKAEVLAQERLDRAVEAAKRGGGNPLDTAQICAALEEEKRRLALCFQKQCLKLRKESEEKLRDQLKRQSQAFTDHLQEAMRLKEMEVDRGLARKFDEQLEEERCRYKLQLAAMIGRLRGLEKAMKLRADADRAARQSQVLWAACQTLVRAIQSACPGMPWQTQLRSLKPEITAIQKAAAEGDELVQAVIDAIPKEAKERGVYPEDALRERFLKVEKIARLVALVPEEGALLPVYILSYIQSFLLIKTPSPIPQAEIANEEVDFSKLSTNDILQRARYWLDRGDFLQTLKYMNLLKGASRSVARQWMDETRILLETKQAANTLMAHAVSSGLLYL